MRIVKFILLAIIAGTAGALVALLGGHTSLDEATRHGVERFNDDMDSLGIQASDPEARPYAPECVAELLDLPMNSHLIVTCRRLIEQVGQATGTYTFYENDGSLLDAVFEISAPQEAN